MNVGAVDLDADWSPDASRQHVDAGLDWHRPGVARARQLERLIHLLNELLGREAIARDPPQRRSEPPWRPIGIPGLDEPPLIVRLQDDDRFYHRERCGIG